MTTTRPGSIDAYIAPFPEETRKVLEQIRTTIRKAVPGTEETISYGIPAISCNGRYLIYFAGYAKHIGLYPAPRENDAFKSELSAFRGGKGTVQFPLDKPMPLDLITRIVQFRAANNAAPATAKKK